MVETIIQEILTYLIITVAVAISIRKTVKKFKKKNKKAITLNIKNETLPDEHNCSECSAECILRDTIQPEQKREGILCKKTNIKSD